MVKQRIIEIDILRGAAVAAMVLYHLLFDLTYLISNDNDLTIYSTPIIQTVPILILAQLVRLTFIGLVGVSLWLDFTKNSPHFVRKQVRRALKILVCALSITVLTSLVEPEYYIRFGILHLIGVSILLALPGVKFPKVCLAAGGLLAALGWFFQPFFITQTKFPLPGVIASSTPALDYFPLIPWLGVVLMGIGAGYYVYGAQPTSKLTIDSNQPAIRFFEFLSRHALAIYLLHQPILLAIIFSFLHLSKL